MITFPPVLQFGLFLIPQFTISDQKLNVKVDVYDLISKSSFDQYRLKIAPVYPMQILAMKVQI